MTPEEIRTQIADIRTSIQDKEAKIKEDKETIKYLQNKCSHPTAYMGGGWSEDIICEYCSGFVDDMAGWKVGEHYHGLIYIKPDNILYDPDKIPEGYVQFMCNCGMIVPVKKDGRMG
jgi:hypothetical protein